MKQSMPAGVAAGAYTLPPGFMRGIKTLALGSRVIYFVVPDRPVLDSFKPGVRHGLDSPKSAVTLSSLEDVRTYLQQHAHSRYTAQAVQLRRISCAP